MGYQEALNKAWQDLEELSTKNIISVKLLADEYTVDLTKRLVLSLSCNIPAREHIAILILHYLIKDIKGIPDLTGEWISFREFPGSEGYYPTFRKRVIDPLVRKFATNPEGLLAVIERLPAKRIQYSDAGLVINVFKKLPIMVTLWKQDEEFSGDANILFDKNIKDIYPTEDIVVLSEFVVSQL